VGDWKRLTREEAEALDCAGWAIHLEDGPAPFARTLEDAWPGERLHALKHPSVPDVSVLAQCLAATLLASVADLLENGINEKHPLAFLGEHDRYAGASHCLSLTDMDELKYKLEDVAEWLIENFAGNAQNTWVESGEYYVTAGEDLEDC
jgi:hypothetical protein